MEALHPNHVWQSDMTKIWAGPSVGWVYLVSVIDCCTCEIVGWDLLTLLLMQQLCNPSSSTNNVHSADHSAPAPSPQSKPYRTQRT